MDGKSDLKIAKGLEHDGILTGAGKATWWASTVKSILKNEKYMGEALLQKTHTVDFLTKKRVKNNGIVQHTTWKTPTRRLLIRKSLLRYRQSLKDAQICGDILGQAKMPLQASMPSPGSSSAKTAVRSLEEQLGAPEKISSMCGVALTVSRTELTNAAQKRSRRKI